MTSGAGNDDASRGGAQGIPVRSQTIVFGKRVRDLMRDPPLQITAGATVKEAVAAMAAAGRSSLILVDDQHRLTGILTEQDVVRRIAFQAAAEATVDSFATTPVLSVAADERLYRAVARMRRHGLRHMPVIDPSGRAVGMLDLHQAMAVTAEQMMRQIDRLSPEDPEAGMGEIKRAQIEIASDLLADSLPAPEIQALITDINRDIHCRILEGVLAEMAAGGWGPPPVAFSLLIMGSGGRGENFLSPDQDNGFVLADHPDDEHNRVEAFFVPLAERLTRRLDAVGFPYCKGNVMATNPVWRKTEGQWRQQISMWAARRSPVAVLFADIFFDFEAAWGPPGMSAALRRHVSATVQAHPAFLREICDRGMDHAVALDWLGRLSARRRIGAASGLIDLKRNGTFPLVASVRLWALRAGVTETSTLGRIAELAARGTFDRNDAEELAAAFNHVTFILLRQQLADARLGNVVGNLVDPAALTRRERTMLVQSLKAIGALHKRTRADFTGQLF